jgi:hypothetical protein
MQYNIYTNLYTTQLTQYGQNAIQELRSRNKWNRGVYAPTSWQNYNSNSKLVDILNSCMASVPTFYWNWQNDLYTILVEQHWIFITKKCARLEISQKYPDSQLFLFKISTNLLKRGLVDPYVKTTRTINKIDGNHKDTVWHLSTVLGNVKKNQKHFFHMRKWEKFFNGPKKCNFLKKKEEPFLGHLLK